MEISCPYCREPLKFANEIAKCTVCKTSHHLACWQQHRSCSVTGCEGKFQIIQYSPKREARHVQKQIIIGGAILIAVALILMKVCG